MYGLLNTVDKGQRLALLTLIFKLVITLFLISVSFYLTVRGFHNESEVMISSNINTGVLAYWLASSHSITKASDSPAVINANDSGVVVNESDSVSENKVNP
jgi:hypothetical protein